MVFMVTDVSHGDIGPKPSIVIQFEGLGNESYILTLLSEELSTGPYSAISEEKDSLRNKKYVKQNKMNQKFISYIH